MNTIVESYNEQRERGSFAFPVEYHYVTNHHPRYNMPYHWHIQYEIIRVLKGKFTITIDENTFSAKEGDIIFINDGEVHGGKAFLEDTVYESIVFDRRLFETNIGNETTLQKFFDHTILINSIFSKKEKQIHQIVWMMFNTLKNFTSGYEYIFQGTVLAFLGLVLKENLYKTPPKNYFASSNQRNIHKLKKAFRLIESSYNKALTLEDLAQTAGLSPKYFCRFFQNLTNQTPISYLNYYRIESACSKLVSNQNISITDIAYDCGFNDLSYFIKTFRKYKGTTPNKYLRTHLEIVENL